MNIFIICSVRDADDDYRQKLETYTAKLEADGYSVHLPHRDTNQDQSGLDICTQNAHAIRQADEVHIFYTPTSQGTHFDLGVAFALGKPLVIVENVVYEPGKSFARMIEEYAQSEGSIQRYIFMQDPDGHNFMIPFSKKELWDKMWEQIDKQPACTDAWYDALNKFENVFGKYGIDGIHERYSFTDPQKV